jgi:hypothetical protein
MIGVLGAGVGDLSSKKGCGVDSLSLTSGEGVLGSDGCSGGVRGRTGRCGTAGMRGGVLGATGAPASSGTTRGSSASIVKSGAKRGVLLRTEHHTQGTIILDKETLKR